MNKLGKGYYAYYLENRVTGQILELGPTAELSEEYRVKYNIAENWNDDWEFCCRKVEEEPVRISGTPIKPEIV